MNYTRMNYIEYVSEEIADELEKQYTVNGPTNFPDALCLVFFAHRSNNSNSNFYLPKQRDL